MSRRKREFVSTVLEDKEGKNTFLFDVEKFDKAEALFTAGTTLDTSLLRIRRGYAKYEVGLRGYTPCHCGDGGEFPVWIVKQIRCEKEHKMKEKFDLNNYKGDYVMHCKTEEEADIFCKFLHDSGRKWQSGDSYTDRTRWHFFKENTVYLFNEGLVDCISANSTVDSYTILEFSDFDWSKEKVVDLPKGATMEISLDNEGFVELHGSFSGFKLEKPKFKVGDKVKWNGSEEEFIIYMNEDRKNFLKSKKEYVISSVDNNDNTCLLTNCPYWFCTKWFEKVEDTEYIIGEEYITADSKKDLEHSKCLNILAAYIPHAIKPFVCVAAGWEQEYKHNERFDTIHVKYISKPKFKEYTEFKPDMIGLKIKDFKGNLLEIVGDVSYNKGEVCLREVATNHCTIESLSDLYGYDREDGTIFGEEIK